MFPRRFEFRSTNFQLVQIAYSHINLGWWDSISQSLSTYHNFLFHVTLEMWCRSSMPFRSIRSPSSNDENDPENSHEISTIRFQKTINSVLPFLDDAKLLLFPMLRLHNLLGNVISLRRCIKVKRVHSLWLSEQEEIFIYKRQTPSFIHLSLVLPYGYIQPVRHNLMVQFFTPTKCICHNKIHKNLFSLPTRQGIILKSSHKVQFFSLFSTILLDFIENLQKPRHIRYRLIWHTRQSVPNYPS